MKEYTFKELSEIITESKSDYWERQAHFLAQYDSTWTTQDPKVLMLTNKHNFAVAHMLAKRGDWQTQDFKILKLKDGWKDTVAHYLALYHPNWYPEDPRVLKIKDLMCRTVEDYLYGDNKKTTLTKS